MPNKRPKFAPASILTIMVHTDMDATEKIDPDLLSNQIATSSHVRVYAYTYTYTYYIHIHSICGDIAKLEKKTWKSKTETRFCNRKIVEPWFCFEDWCFHTWLE